MNWTNNCFSKLNIEEGRNPYHGVNGILTHYHIQYNTYIGIVRHAIKEYHLIVCNA